jgi:beta-mannosidase
MPHNITQHKALPSAQRITALLHSGIFVAFLCSVLSCSVIAPRQFGADTALFSLADSSKILMSLDGAWDFQRESGDTSHVAMPVPANWFTQKVNGNALEYAGKAWYTKKFTVPQQAPNTALSLVFEGIDYEAEVWLNGHFLGKHTGYFAPFEFPIAPFVRGGDTSNTLKVCVNSPRERDEDWSLHKRLIKGIFSHHDTRPGGAWSKRGQEGNTGGIWGAVYLKAAQKAMLQDVQIRPILNPATFTNKSLTDNNTDVRIRVQASIYQHSNQSERIKLCLRLRPFNFSDSASGAVDTVEAVLHFGTNIIVREIQVKQPHLWYSSDVGKPHLYTLSSTLLDASNHALDEREDRTGLRSIVCEAATKQWYLNGHRLFLRGTNYIGTQWLSTMHKREYERDLQLMQAANINAIRVHAHVARRDFYQAADEAGILVWQDFPLQWGYADDAEFVQEASAQVRTMIATLYNHPSIIAWCLHNEPPFDADWMTYKYPDYQPMQNKSLNTVLYRIASNQDSTRYVHAFSATKEHHWQGWYSGTWRDHAKQTRSQMITEFGAQALPMRSTLQTIVGEKALFPRSAEEWAMWDFHNFQQMETFKNARVPMGATTDEFIANTQNYQTQITTLAAESYRRQKYHPVGSVFQFMFVECWASINWGIVDYLRTPKPAYTALQQAYKPATAIAEYDAALHAIRLWVVNDRWEDMPNTTIECVVYAKESAQNQAIVQKSWTCTMRADSAYVLDTWQLPARFSRLDFEKQYVFSTIVKHGNIAP